MFFFAGVMKINNGGIEIIPGFIISAVLTTNS